MKKYAESLYLLFCLCEYQGMRHHKFVREWVDPNAWHSDATYRRLHSLISTRAMPRTAYSAHTKEVLRHEARLMSSEMDRKTRIPGQLELFRA